MSSGQSPFAYIAPSQIASPLLFFLECFKLHAPNTRGRPLTIHDRVGLEFYNGEAVRHIAVTTNGLILWSGGGHFKSPTKGGQTIFHLPSGASFAPYIRMGRRLLWVSVLFLSLEAWAGQLPLTTKEVGLMLRSGYSSNSVLQELAKRRFADTFDPDKENLLIKAGASPELIDALERGKYAVSALEAARVKEQMANVAGRRVAEAERLRKSDALYQSQLARERGKRAQSVGPNVIYDTVKGDLVRISNGSLVHAEDESLATKKLIAIYFSAHWCPPCRKFTPELVDFYNRLAPQHPEFELIFFSLDRSNYAMQNYMRETNMPWLAIDYQKLEGKQAIKKYGGSGIPCLVLLDSTGKVISDSYAGAEYLGPGKVLADLEGIFAKNGGDHLATSR